MLDLKALENKLDQALDAETPESARAWLMAKRSKNLRKFFDKKKNTSRSEIASPNRFLFNDHKSCTPNLRSYLNGGLREKAGATIFMDAPKNLKVLDKVEFFTAA